MDLIDPFLVFLDEEEGMNKEEVRSRIEANLEANEVSFQLLSGELTADDALAKIEHFGYNPDTWCESVESGLVYAMKVRGNDTRDEYGLRNLAQEKTLWY